MVSSIDKIISKLPDHLANNISALTDDIISDFEEIRIKCYTDTIIIVNGKEIKFTDREIMTPDMLESILNKLLNFSYYAYEDELSNGFITIEGGHRVGICGKVTLQNDQVHIIKEISSLNIRRSREIKGAADNLINFIVNSERNIANTLIISPPKCGKTTMLRDVARQLSYDGFRVGICDERSEIAGCFNGVPSYDLGPRTDILDGCPKAKGIVMLIRSMSPDVIVTDEIGKVEDIKAIEDAANSGIGIITSIHGNSYEDVFYSSVGKLLEGKVFDTLVFLSSTPATGHVDKVMKLSNQEKIND